MPEPFIKGKKFNMQRLGRVIISICVLNIGSGYFSILPGATTNVNPVLVSYETFILDTLTVYNPVNSQCDSDPLITASNKRINLQQLSARTLRWMALSRNMLTRWGGSLNYGDTVSLEADDPSIDGIWIIQDTMNKRFKDRGDLLFDASFRSTGMWKGVTLRKRKTYRHMHLESSGINTLHEVVFR